MIPAIQLSKILTQPNWSRSIFLVILLAFEEELEAFSIGVSKLWGLWSYSLRQQWVAMVLLCVDYVKPAAVLFFRGDDSSEVIHLNGDSIWARRIPFLLPVLNCGFNTTEEDKVF